MDNKPFDRHEGEVVEITNISDFDFTPELGAKFDGHPHFVSSGETKMFPYKVGNRLALNLAKQILLRGQTKEQLESKKGMIMWDESRLEEVKNTIMKVKYVEERTTKMTETDILMRKVEELAKWKEEQEGKISNATTDEKPLIEQVLITKADVIDELKKRGIKFDARQNKENLEKLLS